MSSMTGSSDKAKPRRLKIPKRTFKIRKQIKGIRTKVSSAPKLFVKSWRHLIGHWKLYSKITLVYLVLTVILVKGFGSGVNLPEIKTALQELFSGFTGQLTTTLTLFSVLVGSIGSASSDVAALYQTVLLIIISLAVIWAMRQSFAGVKVTSKDAFYNGMYPLVQFVLVLCVMGLQLIPLALAGGINSIVFGQGLAVGPLEVIIWLVLIFMLCVVSFYWLAASVFALYIVTLPGSTPLQSLRDARSLVKHRRWMVLRKLLFLPFVLLILAALITLPVVFYATALAEWVFLILSMFGLVLSHTYIYTLYRELL